MLTPELKQIDECYSLYLKEIEEPRDNCLRIVLEEARPSMDEETIELPGGVKLERTRRIEPDENCRLFEIRWSQYISYCVTNETFAQNNPGDVATAGVRRVRVYSRSKLLEYVFPGTSRAEGVFHLEVLCENHIVNVISEEWPEIRVLRSQKVQ
jgi:hypothetical protein